MFLSNVTRDGAAARAVAEATVGDGEEAAAALPRVCDAFCRGPAYNPKGTFHHLGNVFFNGPRAGINANDGFGGGDEIGHNLVFSTCRESGDHGPFNSWDWQPYLTTIRTGQPDMIMQWREIHHNFFIDNYSPQEAVDNDDGSAFCKLAIRQRPAATSRTAPLGAD